MHQDLEFVVVAKIAPWVHSVKIINVGNVIQMQIVMMMHLGAIKHSNQIFVSASQMVIVLILRNRNVTQENVLVALEQQTQQIVHISLDFLIVIQENVLSVLTIVTAQQTLQDLTV